MCEVGMGIGRLVIVQLTLIVTVLALCVEGREHYIFVKTKEGG